MYDWYKYINKDVLCKYKYKLVVRRSRNVVDACKIQIQIKTQLMHSIYLTCGLAWVLDQKSLSMIRG